MESPWLTPTDLAKRQKINERTLAQHRYQGLGPKYSRFGGHVRYHIDDVIEWERAQEVDRTAAAS